MIALIVLLAMLIGCAGGFLLGGVYALERLRGPKLRIATDKERRARLGLRKEAGHGR